MGLFALSVCLTVGQLSTNHAVLQGASAASYDLAIDQIDDALEKDILEGVGSMTHMHLIAGYRQAGAELFIDSVDKRSKTVLTVGPNEPLKKSADTSKALYSYRLTTHLRAGPLLPSNLVSIAYSTRPVELDFSASCPVERPDSLNLQLKDENKSGAP